MLIDVITADFSYRDTNMDFMWFIYIYMKKDFHPTPGKKPLKTLPQGTRYKKKPYNL